MHIEAKEQVGKVRLTPHVVSWAGTKSLDPLVLHSVFSRTTFVHTLGPALQEYLSPEPGDQSCSLLHGQNCLMPCLLFPQISALKDPALWYRPFEPYFHSTITVNIVNWGIKMCLFGPFLLSNIFPLILVFKTKHVRNLWHTWVGKCGSRCELSSQLTILVSCVLLTHFSNLGISFQ